MYEVWQAPEVVTAFGTLLAGAAAFGGAIIAGIGLNSWREQSKWHADRDLAKQLLVVPFTRSHAFDHVRNPFGWSGEEELGDEEVPQDEQKLRGLQAKYERRFEKLMDARKQFYPLELEGDALWGRELVDLVRPLTVLEHELQIEIQEYIESHGSRYTRREYFTSSEEMKRNRGIVFAMGSRDEFGPKYKAVVERLESFLRSKLGQNKND